MSTPRFPPGPLLRGVDDLHEPMIEAETVLHLARARVATADYELIQADFPTLALEGMLREFPELEALGDVERTEAIERHIDAWLVRHAGVVSIAQTQPNPASGPIPTTGERTRAHRPPRYGRALVATVPGGLLDIKGTGVKPGVTPNTRVHHSGLMYLGEALGDLVYQRIIERIFRRCDTAFWTLPTYAILDLGFDAITGDGQPIPAGAQIRRAHRRPLFGGDRHPRGSLEQRFELEVELVLRHFGLTSCNDSTTLTRVVEPERFQYRYGGQPVSNHTPEQMRQIHEFIGPKYERFEGANIQMIREVGLGSASVQVVDFGHFELRERFEHPLISMVNNRLMRWGGMLSPDESGYVQPVPGLALPHDRWGPADEDGYDLPGVIRQSRVDQLAFTLAAGFAAGTVERAALERALAEVLDETSAYWSTAERGAHERSA